MKQNIVIASNFTCEPIKSSLEFLLNETHISHDISFTGFNQIFQQLLSLSSSFQTNERGFNVVLFRSENFVEATKIDEDVLVNIKANINELQSILKNSANFRAPFFVVICPPSEKVAEDKFVANYINNIEKTFIKELEHTSNLFVFSYQNFLETYQINDFNDVKADLYGKIPYTNEFFASLGSFLARKILTFCSQPYKVIVLDCDQTLWKGIVGEDGVDGIEFDTPHLALQNFMVAQSETGMLICLCSKNNEADVWKVFDSRPEMILKREHIVTSQINWNFKSQNLKLLADELKLSLNSFIFIDDDAAVCAEVQQNCPEVLTLLLPANTEEIPSFLEHVWAFDKLKTTKEDKERTKSYQTQVSRSQLQNTSANFADFITKLDLKCEIKEISEVQIPRVSQLTLRTNQFNSTTIRRSENDLKSFLEDEKARIWAISVKDRFGDYGLVGAIFSVEKAQNLNVDSFILSCRALGKGVEHKMLAALGKTALKSNLESVNIEFIESQKNAPVYNFFEETVSKFKTKNGGLLSYKLPAMEAAKVDFNSIRKTDDAKIAKKSLSVNDNKTSENLINLNDSLIKIANHLRTGKKIVEAYKSNSNSNIIDSNNFAKAETKTEKTLTEIWERVLNMKPIGVRDNFFTLGGDSLIAVTLFVEIEEIFGKHLPLTVLIDSPTVAAIAKHLDSETTTNNHKYLVPIKSEGFQTPLFCMHAAGGNVLFYRDLAYELNAEQQVYGLQARGITDKSETAHENVTEMAHEYLKEIRTIQPFGPYKLCGSSFGGLIAFEMACQLETQGEGVSLLALFDTYAPGYPKKKPNSNDFKSKFSNVFNRIKRVYEQISLIETPREKMAFCKKQVQKFRMKSKRKKAWRENQFDIAYAKASGRELPVDIQRNHLAIQHALDTYNPKVFKGEMTLFRAAMQPNDVIFEPDLGWVNFTKLPIIIKEVSGSHGALTVYPYAQHLAKELSPLLAHEFELSAV
jgi:FkbH-like protein